MSDTAVEFPLSMVNKLLVYHSNLIGDSKKQMKTLQRDLRLFNAFLKRTVDERRKDERTKVLCRKIHDVVYDLEDVLDIFVSPPMEKKAIKSKTVLHIICRLVGAVREEVEKYWIDMGILGIDDDKFELFNLAPRARQKHMVGFTDVTEELISRLIHETDYFDVVSLIGFFGLGKKTVAWKIFNDPEILNKFPVRIWLPMPQEFSEKSIFLTILKEFTTIDEELRQKDPREIAECVFTCLERATFLIVLLNVWDVRDWDRLRVVIPQYNTKGKILITSRNEDVGYYASRPRPPNKLRYFTPKESWELLRLEALGKQDCHPELENVGKQIASDCQGFPFIIVVIGGILATKISPFGTIATRKSWEEVSTHVRKIISEYDPEDQIRGFIFESYGTLPNHLRSCFLYFGLFPEGYEIPVSKLICMWIGEGFIQPNYDYSLEETARMYLEELSNRNLISIEKFKPDGEAKTCRIHEILHDFCRKEAKNENFLKEIWYNEDGQCILSYSEMAAYRRLSIHSNCLDFISSKSFPARVRTFVSFSHNQYIVTPENSLEITRGSKLLRVLDVLPFKFIKVDRYLCNLVLMRYMALSSNWSYLSSEFNKLWNLHTLIVHTTSRTLEVKADIWKMRHLRHFKTNASAILSKPSRGSKHGAELQTLGTISAESCTAQLRERAHNLKKLGIRGKLALLFERKVGSFDSLGSMEHLRKLKLVNDQPQEERRLYCFPRHDCFPSGLTSLTLCSTFLNWDHISTLGLLEKLEVLKLKDHAFMGNIWEVEDGGFHSLEFLHIEQTDLAFWKASRLNYPKLRSLVLKNCEKLREIPMELAEIPSFQKLELYFCISAAKSAKKILDAKKQKPVEGSEFMLSIYPSIE